MKKMLSVAFAVRGSMRVRSTFHSFKMPESMAEPGVADALEEIGNAERWDRELVVNVFDRHKIGIGEDGIARRMK